MAVTVHELGEQGLLARLQRFCPVGLVGDDAAVLPTTPGLSLVVTTDVLVDGVHFSDRTTSGEDVGWRAAAANLSDLAAMGAKPLGITVGLSLPGTTSVGWLEAVYQGLLSCLQPYNTPIVGGDICRSSVITLAITAFGEVHPAQVIQRGSARPGDGIIVTGLDGSSRAGLELLLDAQAGTQLSPHDRAYLIQAHQRPQPRLDVIPILHSLIQSSSLEKNWAIAGMDSSDGLADAVIQICRASGVGARIEQPKIPYLKALDRWLGAEKALEWALYGGEDFELVLALPREQGADFIQALPGATLIGEITADPSVRLVDSESVKGDRLLSLHQGFQHF